MPRDPGNPGWETLFCGIPDLKLRKRQVKRVFKACSLTQPTLYSDQTQNHLDLQIQANSTYNIPAEFSTCSNASTRSKITTHQ